MDSSIQTTRKIETKQHRLVKIAPESGRTLAPLATTTTTTTANASMTLSSGASRAPSARDRRATSPRDETPKSIKRNKTTVLPACTRSFAGAHRRIRDNRR
uniref:Uncharacterized protein n=1 Tax=Haemonchus contortus TaxID=6289 RepID=A0A7I4Y9I6_HAECO